MSSLLKGKDLEDRIETYFKQAGYDTKRNVFLDGRSGARHEIDVLASRADAITTIQLLIECKAWDKPIEKDVISKVNYVLRDTGLDKAIVVSLGGLRAGADKAAKELGVEIWGRDELKNRLGALGVAELDVPSRVLSLGYPTRVSLDQANQVVEGSRSKFLTSEEIESIMLLHMPCYLVDLSYTQKRGVLARKEVTNRCLPIYDAIEGICFAYARGRPTEIEAKTTIQPRVKVDKLTKKIEGVFSQFLTKVQKRSRYLWRERMAELGLPTDATAIAINSTTLVTYPFYTALLQRKDGVRYVAVDGVSGELSKIVSSILTRNLTYVRHSVKM